MGLTNKIDKTGFNSGRLTVINEIGSFYSGKKKVIFWLCKCECGNEIKLASGAIGTTKSCGCYQKEKVGSINKRHGEANKTKENKLWFSIKQRCYNPNNISYKDYGGKGITVCDRWLNSYEDFLSDIGRAPTPNHSIDRINVFGNYEPGNCKWSNSKEQNNNRKSNVILEHNGVRLTMKQWSEKLGIDYRKLHKAIKYELKSISEFI